MAEVHARLAAEGQRARTPFEALELGMNAFLQTCTEPGYRRILLLDGPAVLGWYEWRSLDLEYGLGLLRRALEAAVATGQVETLPVGLVFRSVGYRGVPLASVPFNESWGVILNDRGRVLDPGTKQPLVGEYTAGWIKRGPTGVIGTNKPDAAETVECMFEDLALGAVLEPAHPEAAAADALVRQRQPSFVSYADWLKLDAIEVAQGRAQGRPRVKLTSVEEMLAALGR